LYTRETSNLRIASSARRVDAVASSPTVGVASNPSRGRHRDRVIAIDARSSRDGRRSRGRRARSLASRIARIALERTASLASRRRARRPVPTERWIRRDASSVENSDIRVWTHSVTSTMPRVIHVVMVDCVRMI
jgi:hypothetical protein